MNVLVFGSNGLLGSNLKKLVNENNEFEKLNWDFSTREDVDLFSYEQTKEKIKSFKPDIIINAAAKVGGINANNENKTSFMIENLKINLNIYEACTKIEPIKIINMGSSCIYPLDAVNPIKENSIMTGKLEPTNSAYAMAKLSSIELGYAVSSEFGHNVINIIPTNLYGPYDKFSEFDSHVIPGLIFRMHSSKIKKDNKFKIWGSGKPLREFLHAEDLADALLFIIGNNINKDLINVGSGKEIPISELALLIKEIIGYKGELIFDKSMPDGKERKLIDSSEIFSLGWKPKISLEDGIKNTYKWYLNNLSSTL